MINVSNLVPKAETNIQISYAAPGGGHRHVTVLCLSLDWRHVSQAHISGLIKSKFTNYKDFHTLMYTCAAEFDFIELEVGSVWSSI